MIALYRNRREMDLWTRAKEAVENSPNLDDPREGEVLAEICAQYLGIDGGYADE